MNDSEFERQIATYVDSGIADEGTLRGPLEALRPAFDYAQAGDLPPTLVVRAGLGGVAEFFAAIARDDGKPQTFIGSAEFPDYSEIEGVELPGGDAYVLSGLSKGASSRNVAPAEATQALLSAGLTPLTIEEGMAIWRVHPESIAINDGISLAGSSRGDKRVPALWISKSRPKLGWCFAGVPHTWLGTASCTERIGAVN